MRTLQSSLNCFGTNPGAIHTKPGILALLKNLLRLNDVTLAISSLLVVLHDLSACFSIFDIVHLTDLGPKTGYYRLISLKMSNNLLIHNVGSKHSDHYLRLSNVESGRGLFMKIFKFYSGLFVTVHV